MKIALVGCRSVETWPVAPSEGDPRPWERDDRPLHAAFLSAGAEIARPSWDDPDVDWSRYDIALLRTTWDYHSRIGEFLAWVDRASEETRLVNRPEVIYWNANKRYLLDLDLPKPESRWLTAGQSYDLGALVRELGAEVAFVKPAIGATSEGTLRFRLDEIARAERHVRALLERVDVILQPYLASVEELGERSAIAINGEITHYVCKIPNPGDWRVQDDYGATDRPHAPSQSERDLAERAIALAAARFGPLPYARVDWLVGRDGPALIELELIEPCLFFRHGPLAASKLAQSLL